MTTYTPRPITIQAINEIMSPVIEDKKLKKKEGAPSGKAKDIISQMKKWGYSRYDRMEVLDVLGSEGIFRVAYTIYSLESLASNLEKPLYDQVFTNYLKILVDFPDSIRNLPDDKFPMIQDEPYELFYMAANLHSLFCRLHPDQGKPIAEVLLKGENDRLPLCLLTQIKDLPKKEFDRLYGTIADTLHYEYFD
jgi:hypothetical protein